MNMKKVYSYKTTRFTQVDLPEKKFFPGNLKNRYNSHAGRQAGRQTSRRGDGQAGRKAGN
jgi:hypothetical protein